MRQFRFYSVIERERKTEIERRRDGKEDETSVRGPLRGPPGIQVTARGGGEKTRRDSRNDCFAGGVEASDYQDV